MSLVLQKITNSLYLVGVLAAKDIVEALRNKLVLGMILAMSIMLLMPRLMGLIIQPPYTSIAVYDPNNSQLSVELENSPQFNRVHAGSISEFGTILDPIGSGLGVEFGLVIPADFDQTLETGGEPMVDGYVTWANRFKASRFETDTESQLSELLGQALKIDTSGNLIYPLGDDGLLLGITTMSVVTIILMIGITLVPQLLFEEKQTRTMASLLVSPASVGEVVAGKALAGYFFVLIASGVVFAIYWAGVVNWGAAILFSISCAVFAVGAGLVLGSFFNNQQEIIGWVSILLVLFTAALFVSFMQLDVPDIIQAIIPWVPSVALAEVFLAAFRETIQWHEIWINLGVVTLLSLVLYALVFWKVSRMDR